MAASLYVVSYVIIHNYSTIWSFIMSLFNEVSLKNQVVKPLW
jgi:hypothetical protein